MLVLLVFSAFISWCQANTVTTYPAHKIKAAGIERIEIIGVRGHLKLTGRQGSHYNVKVSHSESHQMEDWSLLVERRGNKLVLEVANAVLGADWRQHLKDDQWPQFDIDLEGPSLPATVSWREGNLAYVGWRSEVETSLLKGKVSVAASQGKQSLQAVQADVKVSGFRGDLQIKGERGSILLDSIEGSIKTHWLTGNLVARNANGQVQIEGQDLAAVISGQGGNWDMILETGSVQIQNFHGHFKGQGQNTKWQVRGTNQSDVELLNGSGAVDVAWGATAKVFLTTTTGSIVSPFSTQLLEGRLVAQGKKGQKPSGQLFVRTDSGPIRFK